MAAWPHDTKAKLEAAGYQFQDTSKCLAPTCDTTVYWFLTPKGKYMPMEVAFLVFEGSDLPVERYQPHFSKCEQARRFSRKADAVVER